MNVLFLACFLFLILSGAFVFLILNLPIAVKAVAEWCLQNSHQTTLVSPLVLVKIHEVLSTFQSDLQQVQSRTRLVVLVALTLCLRIAKYLGMYLLLLSILAAWHLGPSHVPPILALVVLVIAEASASLPMSGILGFGAYELTWGFMFATLCPNYCQDLPATQIALYLHFITQVVGLSLGLIALILLNILSTSSTKKSSTKSAIKKS